AHAVRARVLPGHRAVPEPQRALIAGFLLGDTGDLPETVVTEFRSSGLSHLVAVSGENVAFVLVLAGPPAPPPPAVRPPRRRARGPRGVRHDDALGAVGAARVRDG